MNKVQIFREVFKGREDVVPRYWKSRKGKNGYSPICRNEWKKGICIKPCRTCDNPDYISLSDNLIIDHFRGKHILGVYPLLGDNNCNFIAADFDDHDGTRDPLKDGKAFYETCAVQNISSYVLRSKSGKGYHSYIFFEKPVQARKARAVAFELLKEAGVIGDDVELSSFDRLFPNQDESSGKGYGNLIALPFQGKVWKQGHTKFLDPKTDFKEPYENQWEILSNIERVTESKLEELIQEWNIKLNGLQSNLKSSLKSSEAIKRIMECDFIQWCKENSGVVKESLWYAMISNLVSIRPGGYQLCHEFSKDHPAYSRAETDMKIHQAMDRCLPHTCKYIHQEGFKCSKDCGVRAPISLVFNSNQDK